MTDFLEITLVRLGGGRSLAANANLLEAPALNSLSVSRDWTNLQRQRGLVETESALEQHYPAFARALKVAYPTRTKLLDALVRWALQDDPAHGLSLSDAELNELQTSQRAIASKGDTVANEAASAYLPAASAELYIDILDVWMDRRSPRWLIGWRDICRSSDVRTLISSVVPRAGVGDKFLLMTPSQPAPKVAALLGCLSSLTCDYVARQKVGGTSFKYFTMKQLAVISPERYHDADLSFIVPRVLELTYTANDLRAWAEDLAAYDPRPFDQRMNPFEWNPNRRAKLRAELDVYYAHLYGLTRDELRYILDPSDVMGVNYPSETFRVLKSNEMREYGEYRTQRLVLEAWDALAARNVSSLPIEVGASSPVYSDQGVIRNQHEAEFAGLVAALVYQCTGGISVSDLQDVLAYVPMAATYLAPADAALLGALAETVETLAHSSSMMLIPAVVQRLEASGAIVRKRCGNSSLYFSGADALPTDVSSRTSHAKLAQLMLMLLVARRALVQGNLDSGEGQEQQASGGR